MIAFRTYGLALLAVWLVSVPYAAAQPSPEEVRAFEARLEEVRTENHIPGMSGAVVQHGKVVWAKGFGYADLEGQKEATPETVYPLASLTKTFASTVIMQLVEEGVIDLDAPVSEYGVEIESPGVVRVRHLLSHTSEGTPGAAYAYSGKRYALLSDVMEKATGKPFGQLLLERIIRPLDLQRTAPNPADTAAFALTSYDPAAFGQYVAVGYASDGMQREAYPAYFGASAGLFSNVLDVAAYAAALDGDRLLRPESKARAWSPAISTEGQTLPYGLGWFVHQEGGTKIVWHYGLWNGHSALLVKVPDQELSFVLLANSDMLSRPYPLWEDSNVLKSPYAQAFYETFANRP